MKLSTHTRPGWSFWVIGVLALLWNAIGAFDYVMTQTGNAEYLSQFNDAQIAFFYGFPAWVQGAWAVAVWFSVLGALLLLLRRRLAVPVFAISLVAMVVTAIHNFWIASPSMTDLMGGFAAAFSAVIFVVAVFLLWYSRRLGRRGLLR